MNENEQPDRDDNAQRSAYAQHAQAAADRARAAAQDALGAARRLITNPAGSIGDAHAGLGNDKVFGVAIVFALVAAIGLALAGQALARALMGAMMGVAGGGGFSFHFGAFLKGVLTNLIAIVALGGGVLLLAPILGGRTNPASALFVAATASLSLGLAALIAAIVGAILQNRLGGILVSLLMLYGFCYLVMVLNAGLRQVAGVDERRAAIGTPTALAIAAAVSWLVAWLFN